MKRRARAAAGKTVKARSRRSLYLKRPTAPKTIATHGSAALLVFIEPKISPLSQPELIIADFCERVNNIDPMCGFGYSPASMALSNRKRIAPSLLLSEITKHTRPWLEVSA